VPKPRSWNIDKFKALYGDKPFTLDNYARFLHSVADTDKLRYLVLAPNGLLYRNEHFCRHINRHGDILAAYIHAFGDQIPEVYNIEIIKRRAHKLYRRKHVQRRLKEMFDEGVKEAAKTTGVTITEVVEMLRKAYDEGVKLGDLNPSVKSAELLGKHLGMFTEKTENTVRRAPDDLDELNKEIAKLQNVIDFPKKDAACPDRNWGRSSSIRASIAT